MNRLGEDLLFERVSATAADTFLGSIWQYLVSDARALVAGRAKQLHVGDRQIAFFFDDPALHVLLRVRTRVPLDHARMFHGNRARGRIHSQHASRFTAVASGNHSHLIAPLDSCGARRLHYWFSHWHYQTSGASETIFAKFFSRNSRATGPNTRVPTASFAS